MLKFLFWLLLLANGALFAYHQGYLNTVFPDGREPGRMARQFNADKIKLLPAAALEHAPAAEPAPAPQPAAASSPTVPAAAAPAIVAACVEIGEFEADAARHFEERLAALALGNKVSRHASPESVRHMVFIPPQGSKEGADKKAGELRQLGIKDFYVMQDGAPLRWGISLGIFRTEEAARAQLAILNEKGVRSARIGPYTVPSGKVVFRLHNLDAAAKASLDRIKPDFPQQESHDCAPSSQTAQNP